ncbi:hypothetical protein U1Q18_012088 [Sarracenia purpurea var. burkii]
MVLIMIEGSQVWFAAGMVAECGAEFAIALNCFYLAVVAAENHFCWKKLVLRNCLILRLWPSDSRSWRCIDMQGLSSVVSRGSRTLLCLAGL